ncbi:MAG: membrane protein insertase YidC [Acidobacteriota bacterium]
MEKRALIAIGISFAILVLWQFVFPPPKDLPPADKIEKPAEAMDMKESEKPKEDTAQRIETVQDAPASFQPIVDSEAREITVESSLYTIKFSNRRGVVLSWKLKGYRDDTGEPLELVSPESKVFDIYPLEIKTGSEELNEKIRDALLRVKVEKGKVNGRNQQKVDGQIVSFEFADEEGLSIVKKLGIPDNEYFPSFEFAISERGERIPASILWGSSFGSVLGKPTNYSYAGQCIARVSGKLSRVAKKNVENIKTIVGNVTWAGMENQYFCSIFIPLSSAEKVDILAERRNVGEGKEEKYLAIAMPSPEKEYMLYVGPKDYRLLSAAGSGLQQIVNFGSISFIAWVAKGLYFSLVWLYNHTVANYGIGIILITIAIRIAFFPLTQKSFVSMKKMQTQMKKVQPKIKSIKERYQKKKKMDFQSRQKMNQEIMDLYKKEGINPMGGMSGCLPLLLQLPFLWAFYNVLTAAIELRHASFILWITDLSVADPWLITPILMGGTMLIQQKMAGVTTSDPLQQKMMTYFMPIFFTIFFLKVPSGLVLYWLVNNVLGIGQQYLINKQAARLLAEGKQ